jgi:putative membrane protein
MESNSQQRALTALLTTFAVILAWSAINPHDYFTWILETWPALAALLVLAATYSSFQFTTFVYGMIWAHAVVLLIGGHYTYAEVPAFNWLRDHLHLARNDFDRVGHFMQGFVPALIAREFFLRRRIVRRGWVPFLVVCVCLSISALYELLEWRTAVAFGSASDAFLGTQGDPWDTQEDMATALVGAIIAVTLVAPLHNRQIARMQPGALSQAAAGPVG